jgi:hypothetical protein
MKGRLTEIDPTTRSLNLEHNLIRLGSEFGELVRSPGNPGQRCPVEAANAGSQSAGHWVSITLADAPSPRPSCVAPSRLPGHAAIRPSSTPAKVCHRNSSRTTVLDGRERLVCIQETAAGRRTW